MLLGRDRELQAIDAVLLGARAGTSGTLALVGEPGIGKTALLDRAAELAGGMTVLRARGVESEAEIPFASLLELLRPALDALGEIPQPQAVALESALALRPAHAAQERFAVGAATLSLLAAHAERNPLAVLIDDAQWLDRSSAQALLFAFRRLVADPVAVVLTVLEGEPSLLDGADLPCAKIEGLSPDEAAALLGGMSRETATRLHGATQGNPLALLELASDAGDTALAPDGAPLQLPARIGRAFVKRLDALDDEARRAAVLAATSDTGEIGVLERAAAALAIDLQALAQAEAAGLVVLAAGSVQFRHPLARSAIYAAAPLEQRRAAHRALAGALPDRDIDSRAWHFAAAAVGTDEPASTALEQAGIRARGRSAYATAAAAFERASRLASAGERRARLLLDAADAAWNAGSADRALALLDEARAGALDPTLLDIDELAGHIATRRGPIRRGHEILCDAAERADGERAVAMLAEAVGASLYAGDPRQMVAVAERARARLPTNASTRARFLCAAASGMAGVVGGDAATGSAAIHEAIELAESHSELQDELRLLPWLAAAPIFLRETDSGRSLLERSLTIARARAALGMLPRILNLIARDDATTDRWMAAEAAYREAIDLARENDQRTDLVFGVSGLAWLLARRGDVDECRACASEALELCRSLGTELHAVWATAALGELELGLGNAAAAADQFERQREMLHDLGITDVDLSPGPELVEAYLRLGREDDARQLAGEFATAASAKGQPWSLARALRSSGLVADEADVAHNFDEALRLHDRTPDAFEAARTRLAYGERLRRARNRVLARPQLREALEQFERLGARPWAERARVELEATGETVRKRDPTTVDDLTPQEMQIALLLAGGKTTREAAAALFLSPKTIEYHLRHVYRKLDIHSREELADVLEVSAATQRVLRHFE